MQRGFRRQLTRLVIIGAALLAAPAYAQQARGVADPTTSWGLSGLSDWSTSLPLLDVGRLMRPFFGFTTDEWEAMDHASLVSGDYLDADGYPVRIPRGLTGIRTIWAWDEDYGAEQRKGTYVLTYQGRGAINLGGAAEVISSSPGRIIFENGTGGDFWMDITGIDSGNHVRDISIMRTEHVALAEAGAMFNPNWLALIEDARELRFMDWAQTNNSTASRWADRPVPKDATWTDQGIPVEVMIRLANDTGTDPWFTIPHQADDDYVRQFATMVRDTLDPRLKAHFEYSNELWNGSFEQFGWLRDQAIAEWGDSISDDWETIFSYHTKRATHVALICEEVFGAEAPTRLINVLGGQAVNAWLTELLLTAPGWKENDPDSYVDPATVFEEFGVAAYFGVSFMADPDRRAELARRMKEDANSTYSWMFELVSQDGAMEDSVPGSLRYLVEQQVVANKFGLRLIGYEGGQHMHHSFAVDGMTDEEADEIGAFMAGFVRSPEMGALYAQLWDGWKDFGDGPFMQYTETSAPSRWGSWGILSHPGDKNPRADFIIKRQAEGGSWWGEGGGPQYLQGRTERGGESADQFTGTDEEDYFTGLGGDDTFTASPGRDGINGGEGTDTFILPDPQDRYTVAAEGAGHRVTGPLGSTYLVHVEQITFGDGTTIALD